MSESIALAREPVATGRFVTSFELPRDSLARSENWPVWAVEAVGGDDDLSGGNALRLLQRAGRGNLYFLGTPELPEKLFLRVSQATNADGQYYTESEGPKITLVQDYRAAIMRAVINRHSLAYLSRVDERCVSAWYPYAGGLQVMTTRDMMEEASWYPYLSFVAVCDRRNLDERHITEDPAKPFEIHLRSDSASLAVRPELIVPVSGGDVYGVGMVALEGKDGGAITRAQFMEVYEPLRHGHG